MFDTGTRVGDRTDDSDGGVSTPIARLSALLADSPSAGAFVELAAFDPAALTLSEQALLLRAWERQRAWLDAQQQPLLVAVGSNPEDGLDWGRAEVAAALRLSSITARRRIDVARDLLGRLHCTGEALGAGRLSYLHALALSEDTCHLEDDKAVLVEEMVLPLAVGSPKQDGLTLAAFRRAIAAALIAVDPKKADDDHESTVADRCVRDYDTGFSTGGVAAERLPADDVAMVIAVLRARAGKGGADDVRTRDQRLADAFIGVFADAHARLDLPMEQRQKATTQLTLDLPTWLGLADNPAYLAGFGPIPPDMARRIAGDSDLRRLITDPLTGELLDLSPRTYRPGRHLTETVLARWTHCTFPGCGRAARRCDLDHITAHSAGGHTVAVNLHPLCRRHHRMKHATWQARAADDRTVRWTSPANQRYVSRPHDYRPLIAPRS